MTTAAYFGEFSVEAEVSGAAMTLNALQRQSIPKATAQGMNRAIMSVRGLAVKMISQDTGIKQKEVRAELHVTKASTKKQKQLRAVITSYRRPQAINLIQFVAANRRNEAAPGKPQFFRKRAKKRVRRGGQRRSVAGDYKHKGVQARAWKQSKTYAGTFIVRTSKGLRVVKRSGGGRSKLSTVSGPSVKATMVQPYIDKAMRHRANQRFSVEFGRALENDLRRRALS